MKNLSFVPENITVQDVAEADDQVIIGAPFLVSAMDEEEDNLADGSDYIDEEVKAPSLREVDLESLKNYSLSSKNRGRQMIGIAFNFENLVIVQKSDNYKQSKFSVKTEKTFLYCNNVPFLSLFLSSITWSYPTQF